MKKNHKWLWHNEKETTYAVITTTTQTTQCTHMRRSTWGEQVVDTDIVVAVAMSRGGNDREEGTCGEEIVCVVRCCGGLGIRINYRKIHFWFGKRS